MKLICIGDYAFNPHNVSGIALKGKEINVHTVGTAIYHTIHYKTEAQAKKAHGAILVKWARA